MFLFRAQYHMPSHVDKGKNRSWAHILNRELVASTLTLQKSRMPLEDPDLGEILGVTGEAGVLYRKPLTTQEMWYHPALRDG